LADCASSLRLLAVETISAALVMNPLLHFSVRGRSYCRLFTVLIFLVFFAAADIVATQDRGRSRTRRFALSSEVGFGLGCEVRSSFTSLARITN
jgi:hypothetical protein